MGCETGTEGYKDGMRTTAPCICGQEITAPDTEALVTAMIEHLGASHPELQITPTMARNYVEALDRLTGPTERKAEIGAVVVHTVTDGRIGAVLDFFDHDAFAADAAWASCYCRFHHVDAAEFGHRPAARNRADLEAALRSGETSAMVASVDGRLAGWCNASRRAAYPAHRDGSPDDDKVAAIVCFVVAPPYREHGVARRLLDATVERLTGEGVAAIEAYPVRDPAPAASAYVGTVPMYTRAGFEIVSDDDHGIVMRRPLT